MTQKIALAGISGLVLGIVLTMLIFPQKDYRDEMPMKMDHESMIGMNEGRDMTMSDMNEMLAGKTGDDFDKAFIEAMIPHHEGAIDMAESAQSAAGHAEIKTMADAIISTQAAEIEQMKGWYNAWGYGSL